MTKEELLYFSLKHQYFLAKADKARVVSDLCGLQAQFANNPKYALQIRASDYDEENWSHNLVKTWSFRGTLHAVRRDELGLFLSARGVEDTWDDSWGLDAKIKPYWAEQIYNWIGEGINEREKLKEKCRAQGMEEKILKKVFHGWGGLIREMCNRGMIAYDGGTAKRFVICDDIDYMEQDLARIILLKRYFSTFGPATIADCAAFTGYIQREVVRLLKKGEIPLQRLVYEGTEYFYLQDLEGDGTIPPCLFLTGFDQLILGYKDRSRFMHPHDQRNVITLTGIVFPTILVQGKLQARWKKERHKLVITPFRKITKGNRAHIIAKGQAVFGSEIKEIVFLDALESIG